MVNGRVKPKLVADVSASDFTFRNPDRARPCESGKLAYKGPNRPTRRSDDDRFAGLGLTDHLEA